MKLVSVIVTNYNGKKYLKACFDSLLKQTYPNIELILSDDGSTDGSVDAVRRDFPQVKISVNNKNSGLSVTSNNGAMLANGDYLLFYNNDTIAFSDFIEKLVASIEADTLNGVAYPFQLPYRQEDDSEYYRKHGNGFSACGADIFGNPCPALSTEKMFYPDAAIFIKRKVFNVVGGFDPKFFLYGEDVDICWRVHLLGYKIVYAPDAKFRHDSGCSQTENDRVVTSIKRRALVERQVINMMLKYYRLLTLLWIFPVFFILFTAEALFFLFVGLNFRMFFQVYLKAIWWNIVNIRETLAKRKAIQKIRVVSDRIMMGKMYKGYAKLDGIRRMGIPVIK